MGIGVTHHDHKLDRLEMLNDVIGANDIGRTFLQQHRLAHVPVTLPCGFDQWPWELMRLHPGFIAHDVRKLGQKLPFGG